MIDRYRHLLERVFGPLEEAALLTIAEESETIELSAGKFVCRQHELDPTLYIALSGRFRAIQSIDGIDRILGDIGPGEPLGELSLLLDEPRSASVFALRSSTLLKVTRESYYKIASHNPKLTTVLSQYVIKRIRNNAERSLSRFNPRIIALVPLDEDLPDFSALLSPYFSESNESFDLIDYKLLSDNSIASIFDRVDESENISFLLCDEHHLEWSRQCILYADIIVLVANFYSDRQIRPIENALEVHTKSIYSKQNYLLLLHPVGSKMPRYTRQWFDNRSVSLHIHLRLNNVRDIHRFCRIVLHRATGLVLSGGGSKGFAHIGALRALLEAGVEIDFLTGSSAGALYGVGMVWTDFDIDLMYKMGKLSAERKLTSNDWTIPVLSIMTGKKMLRFIKDVLGDAYLEDFWVNHFYVSTNFSNASTAIHDKGIAWQQIQAAIAIPGIYPPVVINNQIHIDGGVMDNLPIEHMSTYPVSHVIALSLVSLKPLTVEFDSTPSPWSYIWDKIKGKRMYNMPNVVELISHSLVLNSRKKQILTKEKANLYFEVKLEEYGLMNSSNWSVTLDAGYSQVKEQLDRLPIEKKYWKKNTEN